MYIEIILYSLLAVALLFLLIILIRAIAFKPLKELNISSSETVLFDKDKALSSLQELIKVKTVSYEDKSLEDKAEFDRFYSVLEKLYPTVTSKCQKISVEGRGVLLKLCGKSSDKPTVLMAHYDVVPADSKLWSKPVFEGVVENGVLYGRGAVDTKITLNGALFATETLLLNNFIPDSDIYFAFSGEEEISGVFASNVVNYFQTNGITPELVLDEGGAVVENVFPGVKKPCALIGIAEKGIAEIEFVASSNGGHASTPKPNSPIANLSKVCVNVENKPLKMVLSKPVKQMFNVLARHSSFVYKIVFANLWCFSWLLDVISKKSGGELNALLRTTVAFTKVKGSDASNVIPTEAVFSSNVRIAQNETIESTVKALSKRIDSNYTEIRVKNGYNPSVVSVIDKSYDKVKNAVLGTFNDVIVSPYLMLQCSDSRYYGKITDKVYRFSACDLTQAERRSIHGVDENIRVSAVYKAVEFYIRLIKNS